VNEQDYFRPFEFLKLLRDKKISSLGKFLEPAHRRRQYGRMAYYIERGLFRWQAALQELGLIEMKADGEILSTERLTRLFSSLDISLTRLANYTKNSIVCSPIFGVPWKLSVKSDIFVIMPFLKELKPVYEDHIRSAAQKMNLTVTRGDDFFTAKSVMSDIWNAMNACRLVIADCTGRNPNVFYEMGMAHTLGKPVILISQNKEDIPFDIQHIRYIIYEFTPRGMMDLEKNLTATIQTELADEFSYKMLLTPPESAEENNS
jgi:nucleoside 2-deoxyribosyltransferase